MWNIKYSTGHSSLDRCLRSSPGCSPPTVTRRYAAMPDKPHSTSCQASSLPATARPPPSLRFSCSFHCLRRLFNSPPPHLPSQVPKQQSFKASLLLFASHAPPPHPPLRLLQAVVRREERRTWGSCWWSPCLSSSSPSCLASAATSSASTGAGRRCGPASARRSTARRCRRRASSESPRRRLGLSRSTPRNRGPRPSD